MTKRIIYDRAVLRGPRRLGDLTLSSVRLRGCMAVGTSIDPMDWPRIENVRVGRTELWDRTTTSGAVLADCHFGDISTKGPIVLLALVLRQVVLSGRTGSLSVRQYGYVDTDLGEVCSRIRAETGDTWALDIRDMVPTGHVEFSLVVEPWQVAYNPVHARLLARDGADKVTEEDLAHVARYDSVTATILGIARMHRFIRTTVLTSTTPNPPWFAYLDDRGLSWQATA